MKKARPEQGRTGLTVAVCAMIFIVLTVESPRMFAGQWSTVMGVGFPTLTERIPHLPFSAWDLALVLLGLVVGLRQSTWRDRVRPLDLALLVSFGAIVAAVAWGVIRGGDVNQMYFQLQGLILLFLLTHVLLAVCRRPKDLTWVAGTILAAALYRAAACVYFFFFYVRGGQIEPYPQDITGHDDSALWAAAIVGLAAWVIMTQKARAWLLAAPLTLLLALAIHYNNRRLAWVEVLGGIAMLVLAMPRGRPRRMLFRLAVLALPVVMIYTAVGWNRTGGLFTPVQQLKSVLGESEDDSSLSRDVENTGLIVTLHRHRALGTGFGHEYYEVSFAYSAGMQSFFEQYLYLPHNSLLGLVAYTGILLFPLVWIPLPIGAFLSARAAAVIRNPHQRVLALSAFAVPFIYSAQAYGDMGLQSATANVLLAAAFAGGARLALIAGAWPAGPRRRRRRLSAEAPAGLDSPAPARADGEISSS